MTPVNEPPHDQSPDVPFSPEVVARLRIALKQWIEGDGVGGSTLRDAVNAVASEARARGVKVEELLVALKTTWFDVGGAPNVTTTAAPSPTHKRLDELVTACIEAYYGR